jgi:hypothetical protein
MSSVKNESTLELTNDNNTWVTGTVSLKDNGSNGVRRGITP